jgi:hypothetical protein
VVFEWLEKQLVKEQVSIDQVVRDEHRRQAAAQVTVGNIITSMRLLSTLDWKDFFETVSLIDPELAKDPAGIYSRMDFATRDRYRHMIERVSKRTRKSELEIAQKVLALAEAANDADQDSARAHVGYFLIDEGLPQLEGEVSCRLSFGEFVRRLVTRHANGCVPGRADLVNRVTCRPAGTGSFCERRRRRRSCHHGFARFDPGERTRAERAQLGTSRICLSHACFPRSIFRRAFRPKPGRSWLCPFCSPTSLPIETLIDKLEVTYLANRDEHLYFGLLSDFTDAAKPEYPRIKKFSMPRGWELKD